MQRHRRAFIASLWLWVCRLQKWNILDQSAADWLRSSLRYCSDETIRLNHHFSFFNIFLFYLYFASFRFVCFNIRGFTLATDTVKYIQEKHYRHHKKRKSNKSVTYNKTIIAFFIFIFTVRIRPEYLTWVNAPGRADQEGGEELSMPIVSQFIVYSL